MFSIMKTNVPRWSLTALLCFVLVMSVCVPARAVGTDPTFYASRFGEYASLRDTGVFLGTASGAKSSLLLTNGALRIGAKNSEKAYVLLPDPSGASDSYAIEFTFRFADIQSSNAYVGFLLNSRGDAPSGRTELIIRADGTVDGYSAQVSEIQKKAAAAGEKITVRILVVYGYMVDFRLSVAGVDVAGSAPGKLVAVDPAGWGFVVRNASADLYAVRAVNGDYAALVTAPQGQNYIAPAAWQMPEATMSPPTGDGAWVLVSLCGLSLATVHTLRRKYRS